MATVNGLLSATISDAYGITATTDAQVTIDDTKTVAQLMTDVGTWAGLVQGLSQGTVTEWSARIVHTVSEPSAGTGDVEKTGLFNFSNNTDHYATGYDIPDVAPSILNGVGLIDLANTNVTDFVTFITTAHTVITVVTKGVRALSALKDALISFRKHRRPLTRKTKEV